MALLYSVIQELDWTVKEFEFLKKSSSIEDISRYWSNYLDHLNKFWNKSQNCCKGIKGFAKIESEVNQKRKKDPLLSYLMQARNADTHGASLLTAFKFGELLGQSPIKLYHDDELVHSSMWDVRPIRYVCIPVTNYGVIYTTPSYHLGRPLRDGSNPYEIGQLGISYYQNVLEQLQAIVGDR